MREPGVEKKKISLRVYMAGRIVPALLLLLNYHLSLQWDHTTFNSILIWQYVLLVIMLSFMITLRIKRDVFDESAKAILRRADSVCFRLFVLYMGAVIINATLFINDMKLLGYLVTGGCSVIVITRSAIFWVLDSRGSNVNS